MTTTPTARLSRIWIIWVGVLLTAVMIVVMLAWWLLPRWAPELVIRYAPWPEPALRAWRIAGESASGPQDIHQAMEAHLLDWGPDIGPALRREFENGDERYRLQVIALASEVARADGIAAGTTLPEERRSSFSDDDIARLREDLVQLVLAAMADGSSYLPSNASYVAMSLRDPRTVQPAITFLAKQKPPIFEDLEPVVRFLGTMRDPRAVPVLIHLLPIRHKPHPTVEEALNQCRSEPALDHIIAATRHEHEVVRTWAAKQLEQFPTSTALAERVVALIADRERQVAIEAMQQADIYARKPAGPVLLQVAMNTPDDLVKLHAIYCLERAWYVPSRPFLHDQRPFLRAQLGGPQYDMNSGISIAVLGNLRDPQDVELLLSLMERKDLWSVASGALGQMPLTDAQRQRFEVLLAARP